MTYTGPRVVYRAFSLIFRVPEIRRQYEEVRRLIYLCYTAVIALRALQSIMSGDPRLTAILVLVGSIITAGVIISDLLTPNQHEEYRRNSPY